MECHRHHAHEVWSVRRRRPLHLRPRVSILSGTGSTGRTGRQRHSALLQSHECTVRPLNTATSRRAAIRPGTLTMPLSSPGVRIFIALKLALLVFPRLSWPPHDLFQAGWLGPPGLPEVLVDFVAVTHLGARIADQLPTDQAGVAAVHRVAEHAFDSVGAQELEETRLLNRLELRVLICGRQAREIA